MTITPEQLARSGSEHCHQTALFCWMAQNKNKYAGIELAFAIPNGGNRDRYEAANLKAEGVKAGVPDIFLPVPKDKYAGMFIEMKVKDNKPSEHQIKYLKALTDQHYLCVVCYSWEDAAKCIAAYYNC